MLSVVRGHPFFRTNRAWAGRKGLIPADICYPLLDVFATISTVAGTLGVATLAFQFGAAALTHSSLWVSCLGPVLTLSVLVGRRFSFSVRYGIFLFAEFTRLSLVMLETGILPNTSIVLVILLTSLTLFYGVRAGLAGLIVASVLLFAGAWGWTHGYLPLSIDALGGPARLSDYHSSVVWLRVLPSTALYMAAVVAILHFVLRRLNETFRESNLSLRLLATEQGQRARVEMERARQAELFREADHKFRILFETANDAIMLIKEQSFVSCNRRATVLFGCREEELVGCSITALSPDRQPDGRSSAERAREKIQGVLAGEPQEFEWLHRRPDGTIFEAEVSLNRVEIAGGVFAQAIIRDVTRRKQAEAAVKESEAFRKRVFDSLRTPIVVMDPATRRYVDCNPAAAEIYGLASREAVLGRTPVDVSAETQYDGTASWEKVQTLITRTLAEGSIRFEWRHQRPDGEIWDADVHLTKFASGGRELLQFTLEDITEHKRNAAALAASEERYRLIARCVPDLLWTMDLTGRHTYVNIAVERLTGWTAEEFLTLNFRDLASTEQAARHEARLAAELARTEAADYDRNATLSFESEEIRKDGTRWWAEVSAAFLWSADGRPEGVIGITRDISERKRAEEERRGLQAQLIQAQKMEAVGALAGGVAHDFNNILTAVRMQVGLLHEDERLPADVLQVLEEVDRAARRAADLTRQLLLFSRRQVMQVQLIEVNGLLANLLLMLRRLISEHVRLQFDPAAGDLWVEADSGMLEQVVMNLVVNARDAIPQSGTVRLITGAVTLDAAINERNPDARGGRFVTVAVADTGTGIDDETRKRIFEPFFTTKAVGKGTGLGLATAYGIVQQHRGWIELDTVVGRGSAFTVYLPAGEPGWVAPEVAEAVANRLGGTEDILVVEDEPTVRYQIVRALRQRGYRVTEAEDGADALRQWEQGQDRAQLVVTDMVMPGGLSGIELAERLGAGPNPPKILLMSGYSPEILARGILETPAFQYLQKPFAAEALAQKVRECLDAR